jgi:hypothetical protein
MGAAAPAAPIESAAAREARQNAAVQRMAQENPIFAEAIARGQRQDQATPAPAAFGDLLLRATYAHRALRGRPGAARLLALLSQGMDIARRGQATPADFVRLLRAAVEAAEEQAGFRRRVV